MPSTQQNSILGVIAVVFIIAIIAVCFWPSCADKSSPPVQLTREKEAVNLASADIPKKHKELVMDLVLKRVLRVRKSSTRSNCLLHPII